MSESETNLTAQLLVRPSVVVRRLFQVLGVLVILSLTGLIGVYYQFFLNYRRLVEMEQEQSIPTWFAGFLLFVLAILAGLIAHEHQQKAKPYARYWFLLSILFLGMSLDEIATLHEKLIMLRVFINGDGLFFFSWVIVGLIFIVVFVGLFWRFVAHLPAQVRRWFIIGFTIFFAGAVGVEMLGGWLRSTYPDAITEYLLLTVVEETMEKAGAILLIYALLLYLRDHCELSLSLGTSKEAETPSHLPITRQPLVNLLYASVGFMTLMAVLGQLALYNDAFEPLRHLFTAKYRLNFALWYTNVLFIIAMSLAFVIAWYTRGRDGAHQRHWWGLGVMLLLLSVNNQTDFYGYTIVDYADWAQAGILYGLILPTSLFVLGVAWVYRRFWARVSMGTRLAVGFFGALVGQFVVTIVYRLSISQDLLLPHPSGLVDYTNVPLETLQWYFPLLIGAQFINWLAIVFLIDTLFRYAINHTPTQISFKDA